MDSTDGRSPLHAALPRPPTGRSPDRGRAVPTLREVALEAGVAVSTASRALSGHPRVDARTRAAVRRAALRLGYHPNPLARGLRRNETKIVGLVIPTLLSSFYERCATVVQADLRDRGYQTLLSVNDSDPATDRDCLASLLQHHVDGLIHVPCTPTGAAPVLEAFGRRTPLVELNRHSSREDVDAVSVDDRSGMYQLTRHVLASGHRRVALVSGALAMSTTRERTAGFLEAHRAAGVAMDERLLRYGDYSLDWGRRAVRELMAGARPPTAVVATSDQVVLGILQGLRDLGLSCPADLSLVAYADSPWHEAYPPGITSYALPLEQMGRAAGRALLDRLEGRRLDEEGPTRSALSGRLLVRASCVPPDRD